jgi:hypothetical protein
MDPVDIVRLKELGQLKNSNGLIGTRTRDLPVCSIVPQPTTRPRARCSSYCNIDGPQQSSFFHPMMDTGSNLRNVSKTDDGQFYLSVGHLTTLSSCVMGSQDSSVAIETGILAGRAGFDSR